MNGTENRLGPAAVLGSGNVARSEALMSASDDRGSAFFIGAYAPIRDLLNSAILAAVIGTSADLVLRRNTFLAGQSGLGLMGQA